MSGKEWSSLIERLLYALDWAPEQLAKKCNVHPSTVGRWIDDEVFPRRKNWMAVVKLFDCTSLEELVDRVEETERERRLLRAAEVAESGKPNTEFDQIVRLVYLVLEPVSDREKLIQKFPFLNKLAKEASRVLTEEFRPLATELRSNLEILEGEFQ